MRLCVAQALFCTSRQSVPRYRTALRGAAPRQPRFGHSFTQHDLLGDFYRKHPDEFESIAEYVDDGHTGTDANREDFQRLLADVMSGKINCVIVKDLSRFARNYSDAGSLIDNLFVQMGVRFISLAENVDSYRDPDSVSSIIVPITNVMNDQYCYQTSKKIRQVFDYKTASTSAPLLPMAM